MGTNRYNRPATRDARRLGYRSGLEANAAEQLKAYGVDFEYESKACKFIYYKPITNGRLVDKETLEELKLPKGSKVNQKCTYTCDFMFVNEGTPLFVETKGYLKPSDRAKHLLIKDQHPGADIRLVFSSNGIVKKGKNGVHYRYADWATDHGFNFHIVNKKDGYIIPRGWYK